MNATTRAKFPAWFGVRGWSPPIASAKGWVRLKIPAADRQLLLEVQNEYDALLRQLPDDNPTDLARKRWTALQEQYAANHDASVLEELDRVGVKGATLEAQIRQRNHAIIDAANRLAAQKNCSPLYVRTFEAATAEVLQRVYDVEKTEREANELVATPYAPSPLLKSLCALAVVLATSAESYRANAGEQNHLAPPSQALEQIWPAIANSAKEKAK